MKVFSLAGGVGVMLTGTLHCTAQTALNDNKIS